MNPKHCSLIHILIYMCITFIPNKSSVHAQCPITMFRTGESHSGDVSGITASITVIPKNKADICVCKTLDVNLILTFV